MITVIPPCQQSSSEGPAACFTGSVRIDSHFQAEAPARVGGATVTFAPGARTGWHSHPLGQTLLVVAGVGVVQQWGEPAQTIRPGDLVWIPPNTKHWHGATSSASMIHIAIAEAIDGMAVEWMEQVSFEQYAHALRRPA
ncbi:(R)-mandelonitrile lyase [Cupriavidus sp. RAF12]|uniref:(R)-mandelonitrile lyase n=1 Tax=Cupriavidus sp. RAF12 TaxID=3233050 RepID=UPI003F8ECCD3